MEVLISHSSQQYLIRYLYSFILVFLLSKGAICEDFGNVINQKPRSPSILDTITKSSVDAPVTGSKNTTQPDVALTRKTSNGSRVEDLRKTVDSPSSISHDNIPDSTGLPEHTTDLTTAYKPPEASSVLHSSSISSSTASVGNSTLLNHSTSVSTTVPVHRKSKPEETHIDDIVQDSGPTTDYVVPLVVAMLAVPLVGVLCALLYMKGRDFWDRRHYGRIDFLWDSRNDSRMDFLIDGMYRE